MFMTNIPRRKIYEKMLEYEDIILEMHILLLNQTNFEKYKEKITKRIPELKEIYKEIKILFILFLENKKFEKENDFFNEIKILKTNIQEIENKINNNQNIHKKAKETIKELNQELEKTNQIKDYNNTKELFKLLDKFNSGIPKLLEIRRDKMK